MQEFYENGGKVGGQFEGVPLLLLHSIGAKSGKERVNPLGYVAAEGRLFIIGSNGGESNYPNWYYNLLAHPEATVEIGTETYEVRAAVLQSAERNALFAGICEVYPVFSMYQEKAQPRVIPIIELIMKEKQK